MLRAAAAAAALAAAQAEVRVGLLSDLHIGEGCPSPYDGSDDCYSVQNLKRAVAYINDVLVSQDGLQAIFITGDVTSSAEAAQYTKVRALLDALKIPYLPVIGNHDVWPYNAKWEAPAPTGDALFASTFADVISGSPVVTSYPNTPVHNPQHNCTSQFQNFEVTLRDEASQEDLVFFGADFNTRDHALPGYKGALPQADLHNFTGGTLPWLEGRLAAPRPVKPSRYFMMHHQPYRCPVPIPDWSFCFSGQDKAALQDVFTTYNPVDAYWGVFAGHLHIFSNGTAFDNWPGFRQWETSACKGNALDANLTSAIASVFITGGDVTRINSYWYLDKWYNSTGN